MYYYLKDKNTKYTISFVIPIIIIALLPSLAIENHYRHISTDNSLYKWNGYFIANHEYLPEGTDLNGLKDRGEIVTSNNKDIILKMKKKGNVVKVEYKNNNQGDTYIEVPLLYYYGYSAISEDKKECKISKGNNNVIRVKLTKNEGKVKVYYKGTIIQKSSLLISIITWIVFILYYIKIKLIRRKKTN